MTKNVLAMICVLAISCATGDPGDGVDLSSPLTEPGPGSRLPQPPGSSQDAGPISTKDASAPVDAAIDAPVDAGVDAFVPPGVCGEGSCTTITVQDIGSHFTGLGCTGIESYYTPYNGFDGIRRSWDGKGLAGTILRTETNRSFKNVGGACTDNWPGGNTLSDFVRIYR